MIAHISPASVAFEESRNTLTYADRAKSIRTRVGGAPRRRRPSAGTAAAPLTLLSALQVKKNLVNVSYHIAQYTNIISDLRCEIQRLKKKMADQSSRQLNSERADIRHVQGELSSASPSPPRRKTVVPLVRSAPVAAEVQAHSSQQSRAEMEQLREQLLEAFRQQMAIRRSLLELENSSVEVQSHASEQLLTIAESVSFLRPR